MNVHHLSLSIVLPLLLYLPVRPVSLLLLYLLVPGVRGAAAGTVAAAASLAAVTVAVSVSLAVTVAVTVGRLASVPKMIIETVVKVVI